MRIPDKFTFPVTLAPFADLDLSNFAQKAAPPNYAQHPTYPWLVQSSGTQRHRR
jgi:hypothetical protein